MSNRKKLIAGNWKMNGSLASAKSLASDVSMGVQSLTNADVLLCPAYIHISDVANIVADNDAIQVGSQDISLNDDGAYTGEVSSSMLADAGCSHVIVGHSERRQYHQEANDLVANKAKKALDQGLIPIVCVGETLEQREADETESVIEQQVMAALAKLGIDAFEKTVIAYEPVWAIGTGVTATPEQAQAVHAFIRGLLAKESETVAAKTLILYGGSMKPENAQDLLGQADIDGGLIGGAALKAGDFLAIIQAAEQV